MTAPQSVTYEVDGLSMRSQMFAPAGVTGPRPGVLVFPDAFGLGAHALAAAERVAALGYVALACDFHGGGRLVEDFAAAMEIIGALAKAPPRMRAQGLAALEALRRQPSVDASRIGAIGYCFGGAMALELARSGADVAAVVGFHSTLETCAPEDARHIKGKVLVCIGADDPVTPAAQRAAFEAEMRSGGVDWRMSLFGGVVHSFTDPSIDRLGHPQMARYDAAADRLSWADMSRLFEDVFEI